ncbi:lipase member J-like isoform X2 [Diachasmimorpha longicaudata]|uniref:lipase member J-like isoform X2 n=1 Tax=Diachasmimorpha longicaudata TaxID=58733 RepID=UPI0030B8D909
MIVSVSESTWCVLFLLIHSSSSALIDLFRIPQVRTPGEARGMKYYALDFMGLAEQYGYRAETHDVTTDDGYILSINRILPNGIDLDGTSDHRVVFLQHGMAASSDSFVLFGPNMSLAYLLSDAGYDVWLGNVRGNTYGRRHTRLSPNDSGFWDFSLDELATLDLAAMIDYVVNHTRQSSMTFVGYSIGGTIGTLLLADRPEYNEKINLAIFLAPFYPWAVMTPMRQVLVRILDLWQQMIPNGAVETSSQTVLLPAFFENFCMANNYTIKLCLSVCKFFVGVDGVQTTVGNLNRFTRHFPSGTSLKVFNYFLQRYNKAASDPLVTKEDLVKFSRNFVSSDKLTFESVNYPHFGHLDFVSVEIVEHMCEALKPTRPSRGRARTFVLHDTLDYQDYRHQCPVPHPKNSKNCEETTKASSCITEHKNT